MTNTSNPLEPETPADGTEPAAAAAPETRSETAADGVAASAAEPAATPAESEAAAETPAAEPVAAAVAAEPVSPTQPLPPQPRYGQYADTQHAQQAPHPGQSGQPYGQYSGQQHPYGQQPNPAFVTPRPERRPFAQRPLFLAGTAALVGALIGGGIAGGVVAAVHPSYVGTSGSSTSGASTITVNNPSDATQITAVAAAASASVVTINVTSTSASGTGSGVILSPDGYVLTNTHVVTLDGAVAGATIQVETSDGRLYRATVVGTDPTDDLAVIKLTGASGLKPIVFADSSKLNVGQQVIAIGAPLGLSGTVTNGIVSALNRSIQIASSAAPTGGDQQQNNRTSPFNFFDFGSPFGGNGPGGSPSPGGAPTPNSSISLPVIQTDAAINPGNSGGALLNTSGQLVGINVAIASTGTTATADQSGSIGVGFAIPSNVAQRIAQELESSGKATHGLLGATVYDAASQSGATTVGAELQGVTSGGAADKAGLKAGDVITNFDGLPVSSATDLTALVRASAGGASATVTYVRGGQAHDVTLTLGTYSS
ncbi:trypsin-like peptidase domain-containing protein [Gryllotalpicola sp.]|uniref:trypsin-like peptidase domain-containing protein n=1 Tax=Gryllotalpicola sp. TaxID=1932787 RepID=UPI00262AC209|nr:trypsin-like peptidase domain-containing protein [Gryllotalpicola sp.]